MTANGPSVKYIVHHVSRVCENLGCQNVVTYFAAPEGADPSIVPVWCHEHEGFTTTLAEWQDAWERAQQRADDLSVEVQRLRTVIATTELDVENCTKSLMSALGERNLACAEVERLHQIIDRASRLCEQRDTSMVLQVLNEANE
jgi:hypothetical protein